MYKTGQVNDPKQKDVSHCSVVNHAVTGPNLSDTTLTSLNSPASDNTPKSSTTSVLRRWRRPDAQDTSKNVSVKDSSTSNQQPQIESQSTAKYVKYPSNENLTSDNNNSSKQMNTSNAAYATGNAEMTSSSAVQNDYSLYNTQLNPLVPQNTARPYDTTNKYMPHVQYDGSPNKISEIKSTDSVAKYSGTNQGYYHQDGGTISEVHFRSPSYPIQSTPPLAHAANQKCAVPCNEVSNYPVSGYNNFVPKSPQEQHRAKLPHSYSPQKINNVDPKLSSQSTVEDANFCMTKSTTYNQDSRVSPHNASQLSFNYSLPNPVDRRVSPQDSKSLVYRNYPIQNTVASVADRVNVPVQNYTSPKGTEYLGQNNYYLDKAACSSQDSRISKQNYSTDKTMMDPRYAQSYNPAYMGPKIHSQDPKYYRDYRNVVVNQQKKLSPSYPITEQRFNAQETNFCSEYSAQNYPYQKYGSVMYPRTSPISKVGRDVHGYVPPNIPYGQKMSHQEIMLPASYALQTSKYFSQNQSQDWKMSKDYEQNYYLAQMNHMQARLSQNVLNRPLDYPRDFSYVEQQRNLHKNRMHYSETNEHLQYPSKTVVPVNQKSPKTANYISDHVSNEYLNSARGNTSVVKQPDYSRTNKVREYGPVLPPPSKTADVNCDPKLAREYMMHAQNYRSDVPSDQQGYPAYSPPLYAHNSRNSSSYSYHYSRQSNVKSTEMPPRNISPRRTFQENMPVIVIPAPAQHIGLPKVSPPQYPINMQEYLNPTFNYIHPDSNYSVANKTTQYPCDQSGKFVNSPLHKNMPQTRYVSYGDQQYYPIKHSDPSVKPCYYQDNINVRSYFNPNVEHDQQNFPRNFNVNFRSEYREYDENRNEATVVRATYGKKESDIGKSLKEFLESWEDDEEIVANLPDLVLSNNISAEKTKHIPLSESVSEESSATLEKPEVQVSKNSEAIFTTDQPLYILDSTNISSEALSQYLHIQQIDHLPANIKGYYNCATTNQKSEKEVVTNNHSDSENKESAPEQTVISETSPQDYSMNNKEFEEDQVLNLSTNRNKDIDEQKLDVEDTSDEQNISKENKEKEIVPEPDTNYPDDEKSDTNDKKEEKSEKAEDKKCEELEIEKDIDKNEDETFVSSSESKIICEKKQKFDKPLDNIDNKNVSVISDFSDCKIQKNITSPDSQFQEPSQYELNSEKQVSDIFSYQPDKTDAFEVKNFNSNSNSNSNSETAVTASVIVPNTYFDVSEDNSKMSVATPSPINSISNDDQNSSNDFEAIKSQTLENKAENILATSQNKEQMNTGSDNFFENTENVDSDLKHMPYLSENENENSTLISLSEDLFTTPDDNLENNLKNNKLVKISEDLLTPENICSKEIIETKAANVEKTESEDKSSVDHDKDEISDDNPILKMVSENIIAISEQINQEQLNSESVSDETEANNVLTNKIDSDSIEKKLTENIKTNLIVTKQSSETYLEENQVNDNKEPNQQSDENAPEESAKNDCDQEKSILETETINLINSEKELLVPVENEIEDNNKIQTSDNLYNNTKLTTLQITSVISIDNSEFEAMNVNHSEIVEDNSNFDQNIQENEDKENVNEIFLKEKTEQFNKDVEPKENLFSSEIKIESATKCDIVTSNLEKDGENLSEDLFQANEEKDNAEEINDHISELYENNVETDNDLNEDSINAFDSAETTKKGDIEDDFEENDNLQPTEEIKIEITENSLDNDSNEKYDNLYNELKQEELSSNDELSSSPVLNTSNAVENDNDILTDNNDNLIDNNSNVAVSNGNLVDNNDSLNTNSENFDNNDSLDSNNASSESSNENFVNNNDNLITVTETFENISENVSEAVTEFLTNEEENLSKESQSLPENIESITESVLSIAPEDNTDVNKNITSLANIEVNVENSSNVNENRTENIENIVTVNKLDAVSENIEKEAENIEATFESDTIIEHLQEIESNENNVVMQENFKDIENLISISHESVELDSEKSDTVTSLNNDEIEKISENQFSKPRENIDEEFFETVGDNLKEIEKESNDVTQISVNNTLFLLKETENIQSATTDIFVSDQNTETQTNSEDIVVIESDVGIANFSSDISDSKICHKIEDNLETLDETSTENIILPADSGCVVIYGDNEEEYLIIQPEDFTVENQETFEVITEQTIVMSNEIEDQSIIMSDSLGQIVQEEEIIVENIEKEDEIGSEVIICQDGIENWIETEEIVVETKEDVEIKKQKSEDNEINTNDKAIRKKMKSKNFEIEKKDKDKKNFEIKVKTEDCKSENKNTKYETKTKDMEKHENEVRKDRNEKSKKLTLERKNKLEKVVKELKKNKIEKNEEAKKHKNEKSSKSSPEKRKKVEKYDKLLPEKENADTVSANGIEIQSEENEIFEKSLQNELEPGEIIEDDNIEEADENKTEIIVDGKKDMEENTDIEFFKDPPETFDEKSEEYLRSILNEPSSESVEEKELFINPENPLTKGNIDENGSRKRRVSYNDYTSFQIEFKAPKRRYSALESAHTKKPIINLDEISRNITEVLEKFSKTGTDCREQSETFLQNEKQHCNQSSEKIKISSERTKEKVIVNLDDFETLSEPKIAKIDKEVIKLHNIPAPDLQVKVSENNVEENKTTNEKFDLIDTKIKNKTDTSNNVLIKDTSNVENCSKTKNVMENIVTVKNKCDESLPSCSKYESSDKIVDKESNNKSLTSELLGDIPHHLIEPKLVLPKIAANSVPKKMHWERRKIRTNGFPIKNNSINQISKNISRLFCNVKNSDISKNNFPTSVDSKINTCRNNNLNMAKRKYIDPRIEKPKESIDKEIKEIDKPVKLQAKLSNTFGLTEYTKNYIKMKTGQNINVNTDAINGIKRDPRLNKQADVKSNEIKTLAVKKRNQDLVNSISKNCSKKVKINLQDYRNRRRSKSVCDEKNSNDSSQVSNEDLLRTLSEGNVEESVKKKFENVAEMKQDNSERKVDKLILKPKKKINDTTKELKTTLKITKSSCINTNLNTNKVNNNERRNVNGTDYVIFKTKAELKFGKPKKRRKRFRNLYASGDEDEIPSKSIRSSIDNRISVGNEDSQSSLKTNEDSQQSTANSSSSNNDDLISLDLNAQSKEHCELKCHIKLNSLDETVRNYEINKSGNSRLKLTLKPIRKSKPAFSEVLSSLDSYVENSTVKPSPPRKLNSKSSSYVVQNVVRKVIHSKNDDNLWTITDKVPKVIIKRNGTGYCAVFRDVSTNPIWQPKICLRRQRYIESLVLNGSTVKFSSKTLPNGLTISTEILRTPICNCTSLQ